MSFKVGDWVRRKPGYRNVVWPYGDDAMEVAETWGRYSMRLRGDTFPCRSAERFDLVSSDDFHTDNDLAMALELAYLVERDYVCAAVNTHGLCVVTAFDWNNPEADWLRAEVVRELRERGTR